MADKSDQYSKEETEKRLQKTLKAALNMKPTLLKEIARKKAVRCALIKLPMECGGGLPVAVVQAGYSQMRSLFCSVGNGAL